MKQSVIALPYQCGTITVSRKLLKRELKALESESTEMVKSIDLSKSSHPEYHTQVFSLAFSYWLLFASNLVEAEDFSDAFQPIVDLAGQFILEKEVTQCP